MQVILCKINSFDYLQQIYLVDSLQQPRAIGQTTMNSLSESLARLAVSYSVHNIHLFGQKEMCMGIDEGIHETLNSTYNNFEVKVEIN